MKVEFFFAADCVLAPQTREALRRSLERVGLPWIVEEVETAGPSPTVRVNGTDVMENPATAADACRLDVPTEEQIVAALRHARNDRSTGPGESSAEDPCRGHDDRVLGS